MPKVLALFFGADNSAGAIAQAAADGARSVRFVEVDVRTAGSGESKHKRVGSAHSVAHYDGVVLLATESDMGSELATLLDELQREPRVANMVFGLAGATPGLFERVARLGGIVVGVPQSSVPVQDADEGASALGARVAKVAGWVRHALGHEAEHSHSH
jgi:hypothetical protein